MTTATTDAHLYSVGMCYASACAHKDTPREAVEAAANASHPTGLSHGWEIADEDFASGDPNPNPCEQNPDRLHWLLVC